MNKRTIFKVIAITNFFVLFTVFLLYRNGSLDSYFYGKGYNNFTSPNGGVGAKQKADSIQAKIVAIHKLQTVRLSSSKSIVAIDNMNPIVDSTRVKPTDKEKEMMQRAKSEMMYSSKPGLIVDPNLSMLDSLLKEKQKQKELQ